MHVGPFTPPLAALGSAVIQRWLQALPAGSIKSQLEELLFWNLESTLFFFLLCSKLHCCLLPTFRFSILDYCMCWQRCAPPVFFANSRFFHGGESSCKRGRRSQRSACDTAFCASISNAGWHGREARHSIPLNAFLSRHVPIDLLAHHNSISKAVKSPFTRSLPRAVKTSPPSKVISLSVGSSFSPRPSVPLTACPEKKKLIRPIPNTTHFWARSRSPQI